MWHGLRPVFVLPVLLTNGSKRPKDSPLSKYPVFVANKLWERSFVLIFIQPAGANAIGSGARCAAGPSAGTVAQCNPPPPEERSRDANRRGLATALSHLSKLQVRLGKLAWRGEDHERRKLKPDIVNRLRKVITKPARSGFASFSLVYNSQLVYEDKHGKQSRALRIADKTDLGWSVKLIEPVLRDMWGRITFA